MKSFWRLIVLAGCARFQAYDLIAFIYIYARVFLQFGTGAYMVEIFMQDSTRIKLIITQTNFSIIFTNLLIILFLLT